MKKVLLGIIFCLALTGCTYTTVSNLEMQTIDVHVRASDWQYTHMVDNNYFRCVIDMPEITPDVFNNGEVQAYRLFYDQINKEWFKHILPDVFHMKEGDFLYTITVDCIYGVGWLELNYRVSDFAYDTGDYKAFAPEAMDFSIVITQGY